MLPFLRTAALRRGPAFVARTARPIPRRKYATQVHSVKSGSSELPWIIGSLAFTIPAVVYLMSGSSHSSDHSGSHTSQRVTHEPHSSVGAAIESAKESVSDAATTAYEKASEVTESARETASSVAKSAKETVSEATSSITPERNVNEEAEETVEAAEETTGETVEQTKDSASKIDQKLKEKTSEKVDQAKEKASEASEKAQSTISNLKDKVLPDDPEAPDASNNPRTPPERSTLQENKKPYKDVTHTGQGTDATSRQAGSTNVQSGKQEGLSGGDTWHAELHEGRGKEISKKAEGVHDTAKLKGTVDPKRTGS